MFNILELKQIKEIVDEILEIHDAQNNIHIPEKGFEYLNTQRAMLEDRLQKIFDDY
jgi:hypothetical protein